MTERFVIGIDSSTQSTKAIVWNEKGKPVSEGRAPIIMNTPKPGYAEQNPEGWWGSFRVSLRQALKNIDPKKVEGIAISNQRETVAFLDDQGDSLHNAIVWLDERAVNEVEELCELLGREQIHSISGKPIGLGPVLYTLRWLQKYDQRLLEKTHRILDVQGYLVYNLTGLAKTSWTSADPFGIFDIQKKCWSNILLDQVGVKLDQFPEALCPGAELGTITPKIAKEFNFPKNLCVFGGGGDGQCAGLGVNAIAGGRTYLNLGTAIIAGASSRDLRLGNFWRTLISPTGEGFFLESVQRAGTLFINWFLECHGNRQRSTSVFSKLEKQASEIVVGSQGVLVQTHLSGCMDPHWNTEAKGAFLGLRTHHTQAHLYRASLEALTLESARAMQKMAAEGVELRKINAIGGGAQSKLWMQMIADATQLPVQRSLSNEASSLGAGISAAVGAGWFSSFEEAACSMTNEAELIEPDAKVADQWKELSERQAKIYESIKCL
jgi:xylulokinase